MKFPQPVTVEALARLLDAQVIGDSERLVLGINEIHVVAPGDLTFVDVAKYYPLAFASAADTLLINAAVEPPEGKSLIVTDDPFRDFNRITAHFQPAISLSESGLPILGNGAKIGQGVSFGTGVSIGEEVEIGHGAVIGSHVRIGDNTRIYPGVYIADYSVIGNEVVINANAVIGGEAFYYKRRTGTHDQMLTKGRVVLGDRVHIGANTTIDRGVTSDTVIGNDTKIDNLVQIGHEVRIGRQCIIAAQVGIAGCTVLGDRVKVWGQAGLTQNVHVADDVNIFAQSGVMTDLEAGKSYLGSPVVEHRQQLRMLAAIRKLPDLLKSWNEK